MFYVMKDNTQFTLAFTVPRQDVLVYNNNFYNLVEHRQRGSQHDHVLPVGGKKHQQRGSPHLSCTKYVIGFI
jgi:hypothetical protein